MQQPSKYDETLDGLKALINQWLRDGFLITGYPSDGSGNETYYEFPWLKDAIADGRLDTIAFTTSREGRPEHCVAVSEARWDEFVTCLGLPRYVFVQGQTRFIPILGLSLLQERMDREKLPEGIAICRLHHYDVLKFELKLNQDAPIPRLFDLVAALEKLSGEGASLLPSTGRFECHSNGVFEEVRKARVCRSTTAIWVESPARLLDAGTAGLLVLFFSEDGQLHALPMAREDIIRDQDITRKIIRQNGGWLGDGNFSKFFGEQLMAAKGSKMVGIADRVGWMVDGDTQIYCTGSQVIAPPGKETQYFVMPQPDSVFSQRGRLCDWQREVFRLARGNPVALGLLCVAFSSLLMPFTGVDNGIFHVCGKAGGGKTTILQLLASVFGNGAAPGQAQSGDNNPTFMRKHHATANGLEGLAALYDGSVLLTDEVGEAAGGTLGKSIYTLSSGLQKATMDSQRRLQKQKSWTLHVVSSGEVSMADVIIQAEGTILGGQQDRAADLMFGASPIFTEFHEHGDFGKFVGALKRACATSYGTPCIELVRCAVDHPDWMALFPAEVAAAAERLRPEGIGDGAMRIVRRFAGAEVAGKFAIAAGVIDCEEGEIEDAIKCLVGHWHRGKMEPIKQIADYCADHLDDAAVHIDPAHTRPFYVLRSGKKSGCRSVVAIPVARFDAHFGDDGSSLVTQLDAAGLLLREQANRTKHRFGNNKLFAYAIDWQAVRDAMEEAGDGLPEPAK